MASQKRDPRLDRLRRDLATIHEGKLATQEQIAGRLKLSQETISKAKNGKLKRWTAATEALQKYANMLIDSFELPERVQSCAQSFLAAGGREQDLCEIIQTATKLVSR